MKSKVAFTSLQNKIILNLPQIMVAFATQPDIFLEWARGTGKSTIFALRIEQLITQMPRMCGAIVGETYQQLLTRTLPSTISALAMFGLYKDVHYFIGRKPPKVWKWAEPYEPSLNYDHFLIFYNGAGFHLVSLDNANSGRGLNTDAILGDEAALFDYDKLFNNVLTTNRGKIDLFKHSKLHHSQLFASSVPMTIRGKWLYKMEEEAKKDPKQILYLRASSEHNRHNLGEKWFKDNRRIMTDLMYNAEILNIRPGKVEGGFYPNFDEHKHCYTGFNNSYLESLDYNFDKLKNISSLMDGDCNTHQSLDIACDWGSKINTLVVGQESGNTYRVINSMFVKTPENANHLADKFCDYYSTHKNKHVTFYYDHTAIYTDAFRSSGFADEFADKLIDRKWTVQKVYVGQAPGHHGKYMFWCSLLTEEHDHLPTFLINSSNCKYVIVSMQNAGVLMGRKGFEKDKRPERHEKAIDEETTHFSDAIDTLLYFRYAPSLDSKGEWV